MKNMNYACKTGIFSLCTIALTSACMSTVPEAQKKTRKLPLSWYLYDETEVDLPVDKAFDFLIEHIPDVYTEMAEGHISYEVLEGTPIRKGSHISCREIAGPQEVFNNYVVSDFVRDQSIYFVSNGSRILYTAPNGKVIENESNNHVYWDFTPTGENSCRVSLTIIIVLPNPAIKILGAVFGSKKLWQDHLTEELGNMGRIMEERRR